MSDQELDNLLITYQVVCVRVCVRVCVCHYNCEPDSR